MRGAMEGRFTDPGVQVYDLAEEVLVRCPRCGGCAVVLARLGGVSEQRTHAGWVRSRRRLRCGGCGHARDEFQGGRGYGAPVDPYFGLSLWLVADCCGGRRLWAYNHAHLDLLEGYIAAGLRERDTTRGLPTSLLEKLPAWVKSAKHRTELLRAIRRLRASVPRRRSRIRHRTEERP
ncbi:hypothetical protein ACH4E7_19940 [Kitasatospora sp. NPDC018058]|uniref:hypothetical protein n=1 Tax=Kitasatospora sp. NPDC018058 TaxID=3364025 RepID=UPI0037BF0FBF